MQGSCLERWKVGVSWLEVKENALHHSVYWNSTSLRSFLFFKNVLELNGIRIQKYLTSLHISSWQTIAYAF